jgi:hypothetical protein
MTNNSAINWHRIINNQLTDSSQVDENHEILLANPEYLKKMIELVEKSDNE